MVESQEMALLTRSLKIDHVILCTVAKYRTGYIKGNNKCENKNVCKR